WRPPATADPRPSASPTCRPPVNGCAACSGASRTASTPAPAEPSGHAERGFPTGRRDPIVELCAAAHAEGVQLTEGVMVKRFADERGTVASELSFGAMVVGILVIGGLFAVAQ